MKLSPSLRGIAATSLLAGVTAVATGAVAGADYGHQDVHALFLLSDNSGSNSVLSYARGTDGTVSYVATYPTGGLGAVAAGAVADPLASQGGLALVNNGADLIAVNPGSNTVSVFAVEGAYLRLVQQIASGGTFPNSVASHGNLVAVLNAGGAGTVAEFGFWDGRLHTLWRQVRSLGLANTTPPNFLHAPGQIGYTPDGQHLIVTTKASSNAYEVFSVGEWGQLGASPVVTAATNAVPFAFNFDAQGRLVGAEASTSSLSTYVVNPDGSLTPVGTVSDGSKALCWISSSNGYVFGSNAGSGTVSSFSETSTGAPTLVNATAATAHPGTTDSAVSPDGQTLYVESGGSGTLDVYSIGANGSLTQLESLFNVPLAAEGIAAS
ncbi:MAG: beta-propeller fold lactonase family protein [Acidimicrobiaceae bacterium]|nr:beta-propeller fold lactonase family protein [Acidimicrobiaceae bacterium]